ncbi:MAG: hypothetical protein M1828_003146 [Chrysothrix sp. TS-e1954]|nr:MAG: hypothetical protein M1828_003146 [Chrysothrix sp. TS-e1954]
MVIVYDLEEDAAEPSERLLQDEASNKDDSADEPIMDCSNPNLSGFSATLTCYPAVSQIAIHLDLNDLHNLVDTTYTRGWTWRTRYSTYLGGLGTGIGEGNEGVECGKGKLCLAAREIEKEIDCDATELAELKRENDKVEEEGRHWGGTSYLTQEIEGIGGVVKKKVKKRVKVGAVVKEYEDEREHGDYLSREKNGLNRSWCSWCSRIVPGKKDAAGPPGHELSLILTGGSSSSSVDLHEEALKAVYQDFLFSFSKMPPSGLAILIGAGPNSGAGVARILAHPSHGNMAVALLARNPTNLSSLRDNLASSLPQGCILHPFPTDTTPANLSKTFRDIDAHPDFKSLPLKAAIWHVKHSSKKPFLQETPEAFGESIQTYTTGAFAFAQEALRMIYARSGGESLLSEVGGKTKGTIIFTGTMGALRTNAEFNAYGAGRAGVRSIAQGLAKEHSGKGVHVAHTIINGGIRPEVDEDTKTGKRMTAETVGKTYLFLIQQEPELYTHELDLRPAQEKF